MDIKISEHEIKVAGTPNEWRRFLELDKETTGSKVDLTDHQLRLAVINRAQ